MIDSDEVKKKTLFLNGLQTIKKYWIAKFNKYQEEYNQIYFKFEWNQDYLDDDKFKIKIKHLESEINTYRKLLKTEEESPGYIDRTRDQTLRILGHNPSDWKHLMETGQLIMWEDTLTKELCEKAIKNLEQTKIKIFDFRERLRYMQLRIEELRKRKKDVALRIKKLDYFLDKKYKELRQSRNENLIKLFKKIK